MKYNDVADKYRIDLISFLRNYVGIDSMSLKQNLLKHDDIFILFPYLADILEEVKNDDAIKNQELIIKGELLVVYDAKHKLRVYKNPNIKVCKELDDVTNYEEKEYITVNNVSNLSKDEILRIRRRLRKLHQFSSDKYLTSEIRKKKRKEPHRYREKKEKLINDVDIEEMKSYVKN